MSRIQCPSCHHPLVNDGEHAKFHKDSDLRSGGIYEYDIGSLCKNDQCKGKLFHCLGCGSQSAKFKACINDRKRHQLKCIKSKSEKTQNEVQTTDISALLPPNFQESSNHEIYHWAAKLTCPTKGCNQLLPLDKLEGMITPRIDDQLKDGIVIYEINIKGLCCKESNKLFLCSECGARCKRGMSKLKEFKKHVQTCLRSPESPPGQKRDQCCPEPDVTYDLQFDHYDESFDYGQQDSFDHDLQNKVNHQKDRCSLEAPSTLEFFNTVNEDEWPSGSAAFFLNESRNTGDGIKGIVCSALKSGRRMNPKITGDISEINSLSQEQADYHLKILEVHYDSTRAQTESICQLMKAYDQIAKSTQSWNEQTQLSAFRTAYKKALTRHGVSPEDITKILSNAETEAKMIVREALESRPPCSFKLLPNSNDIRTKYKEEYGSIQRLLPCPSVQLVEHDLKEFNNSGEIADLLENNATQESRYYSFVQPKQIANFLLGIGVPVKYFRVGYENDWYDDPVKKTYGCQFVRDLHARVLERANAGGVRPDCRVCIWRWFSDGLTVGDFADKQYNEMEGFIGSLMPPVRRNMNQQTLPVVLTFKKENHRDCQFHILEHMPELEEPTWRYWGETNEIHQTMIFVDLILNDYPERTGMTSLSFNGKYHNRFGFSYKYDHDLTPSCLECETNRIDLILQGKGHLAIPECTKCHDWMKRFETPDTYPILPGDHLTSNEFPAVRLSFELFNNSMRVLFDWVKNTNPTLKAISDYLDRICHISKMNQARAKEMKANCNVPGFQVHMCPSYPKLWFHADRFRRQLKDWKCAPMHMIHLGCGKTLTGELPRIIDRSNHSDNKQWKQFVEFMKGTQKKFESLNISWLQIRSFTGKEPGELNTGNWNSKHYSGFTRISLYYFGYLDILIESVSEASKVRIRSLRRMMVAYFVLVQYMFHDGFKSSCQVDEKIENYVRLFLSSARNFDELATAKTAKNRTKKTKKKREKKRTDDKADDERSVGSKKLKVQWGKSNASSGKGGGKKRTTDEAGNEQPVRRKKRKPGSRRSNAFSNTGGAKKGTTDDADGEQPVKHDKVGERKQHNSEPFYVSSGNFLSLLNLPYGIAESGRLSDQWDGDGEGYNRDIKKERKGKTLNTDRYLMVLTEKILRRRSLQYVKGKRQVRARNVNLKIYKNYETVKKTILRGDPITGFVDDNKDLFVCIRAKTQKQIGIHKVSMNHIDGFWLCNLWYFELGVSEAAMKIISTEDTLVMGWDHFTAAAHTMKNKSNKVYYTLFTFGWYTNNDDGKLSLTVPQRSILLI